jgi:glycosyltransferase involved in cell wall biosynthesis
MKNVLFIGPYNSPSGWGEAARRYLKVLAKTGSNLCCHPVYMSGGHINTNFKEIEQNRSKHYDIIIQNVLPHLATRFEGSKNILIADFETNHIGHTGWIEHINMMDEVWVDTAKEVEILRVSGVTIPIIQIIMPVDLEDYNIPLDYSRLGDLDGKFIFYFIGEYSERKNVQALLRAFHREFHYGEEDILLVIKSSYGNSPDNATDLIVHELGDLKSKFRLHPDSCDHLYRNELLITERFSQNELFALHSRGNCFVMPSRGESSCLPVLDALYFNSHCIGTKNTGIETSVGEFKYGLVKSIETPVVCSSPPLKNIYTLRETWQEINILDLQKKIREIYNSMPLTGGREYIENHHSVDKLAAFYSSLVS